jgi:hypothetical protein
MDAITTADGSLPERIRVEWSGDDLLALDASRGVVHRIAAFDVRMLREGHVTAYEAHLPADVLEAVVRALHDGRWDRRRVLTTSGALAATGIATMLLPSAALAASVGLPFNSYSASTALTPTSLPDLTSRVVGADLLSNAFGLWEVPTGVTQVEVVAIGTSGGPAGIDFAGQPSPSPYTGLEGLGARIVATLSVTPGHRLVIAFSGSARRGGDAGGFGGSAAAIGDLGSGSSGEWLLVAGGGGGAGQAGLSSNSAYAASGDYLGGNGGDAGIGGNAGPGTAGSGASAGTTIGQGGGGATTTEVGAAGAGTSGLNGNPGGESLGPTSTSGTTRVGPGGALFNNTASGGGGGAGLFGGGSGGPTGFFGAAGGGGGGVSFLRSARLVSGRQSSTELVNRSVLQGPAISLFY